MVYVGKIFPRDVIGAFALLACFALMALKINSVVSGIAIMIITYYFSKRLYEENGREKKEA